MGCTFWVKTSSNSSDESLCHLRLFPFFCWVGLVRLCNLNILSQRNEILHLLDVSYVHVASKHALRMRTTFHLHYQQLLTVPPCDVIHLLGTRMSNPLSVHSASAFLLTYISVPTSSDDHRLFAAGVPGSCNHGDQPSFISIAAF